MDLEHTERTRLEADARRIAAEIANEMGDGGDKGPPRLQLEIGALQGQKKRGDKELQKFKRRRKKRRNLNQDHLQRKQRRPRKRDFASQHRHHHPLRRKMVAEVSAEIFLRHRNSSVSSGRRTTTRMMWMR